MDVVTYALCKKLVEKAQMGDLNLSSYVKSQEFQTLKKVVDSLSEKKIPQADVDYYPIETIDEKFNNIDFSKLSLSRGEGKQLILKYGDISLSTVEFTREEESIIYDGGEI